MSSDKRHAQVNKEPSLVSFTVWVPRDMLAKLNRMALVRSNNRRLVNRSQVVRDLIERAVV